MFKAEAIVYALCRVLSLQKTVHISHIGFSHPKALRGGS